MEQNFRKLAGLLYGIYFSFLLLQLNSISGLLGMVAVMAALIVAYRQRKQAAGTIYESHFQWLIRTFWIGSSVVLPVLTVIASIYFVVMMDTTFMTAAADRGVMLTEEEITQQMLEANLKLFLGTIYFIMGGTSLWWLYRCVQGYIPFHKKEAMPRPMRWL